MTTAPRLTVAVPCFNCADVLTECVAGILNSALNCPAFHEVLLIDGGSTDDTSRVCADLAKDDRVRVLESRVHSASAKRNAALQVVRTAYIAFTDPDCVPATGWLPALAEAVEAGVQLATGRVVPLGPGMETSIRKASAGRTFAPNPLNRAFPFRPGSSNNYLIAVDLLGSLGGFPEDVGPGTPNGVAEDAEINYRALRAGETIHFLAEAEVAHRHPENPAQFIAKKRGYAVGLTYFMFKRHRDDPAVYLSFLVMCAHNLLRACLAGRGLTGRQHWAEFTGRLEGLRRARQ